MAASVLRARGWHAALPLPWDAHSLGYVLRSIGAAALALGLGLYLQLDAPFSAASTVLLLVNPVQGAVVGKGWWRAVGTLAGALAAFVLSALFAQKMLLFVIALGFWLGLCVGVMSLVRHFYATAAVVAGYTVCLALGPAMVEPGLAFGHIVTRASAVIVGVCSLSLVTVLFSRRTMLQRLRQGLGAQRTAMGPQPGEQFRRQLADADEVLDARHPIDLDQLQARLLSRGPGTAGRLAAPLAQQLLGALALLFEVDPAVAEGAGKGHAISCAALSAIRPGSRMRDAWGDRLGAALSADGRRGERRRPL
ncbi:hypothetical protein G039_0334040 [Pseudomonas aeruginosa VRFPA01]|nr:hypothetical protein G039_0334040 [Pseudomonas aeruginosa VRFPA01]